MSGHGDRVDSIITKLLTVTGASSWAFHRYEPIQHDGSGMHCAVWFENELPEEDGATAGSHDIVETYNIRWWEPSPEKASGLVVDEAAARNVETVYEAVKAAIYASQGGVVTNAYQWWFAGGEMFISAELNIRGFQIVTRARVIQAFT